MESKFRNKKECSADARHEQSRNECDPIVLLLTNQIDRDGPEHEYRQRLIAPSGILPNGVEAIGVLHLPYQQSQRSTEEGQTDEQTFGNGPLLDMECFCDDQSGRTESRITRGDGSCHDTENGQDTACEAEPAVAHDIHHGGGTGQKALIADSLYDLIARSRFPIEEIHGHSSPYQCNKPLGDHRAVEHGTTLAL